MSENADTAAPRWTLDADGYWVSETGHFLGYEDPASDEAWVLRSPDREVWEFNAAIDRDDIAAAKAWAVQLIAPTPEPGKRYTIQVYNGDVGGLDLDFYADTYEEAQAIARRETLPGTRGTEIIDEWVQHNDGSER